MRTFRPGQIVYSQGWWACRVVEDHGETVSYVPLEGYAPDQKGQTFTADKALFTEAREDRGR